MPGPDRIPWALTPNPPTPQVILCEEFVRREGIFSSEVYGLYRDFDIDNNGTFILNRKMTDNDITDGLSYTLFIGEMLSPASEDLGWMSGTRASLRDGGHRINSGLARVRNLQPILDFHQDFEVFDLTA